MYRRARRMRRSRRKISWSVSNAEADCPLPPPTMKPPSSTPIDSAAGDGPRSSPAKQLVEALGLSFVVAEDDRRRAVAHEAA